jgi:C_GCAxxG_C_C family probable redox protein
MNNRIEMDQAVELAAQFFGNGYHCAESIVAAVLQTMGEENEQLVPCATAFGGGFGETFTESCGVVSGSMLMIGHLYGRRSQGDSWKEAAQLGREALQKFVALYGTTNCGELRDRFGEEEQMPLCRELVRQGTRNLVTLINRQYQEKDEKSSQSQKCQSCA